MSSQHNEASPLAILGIMIAVVIGIVGITTWMGRQNPPPPAEPKTVFTPSKTVLKQSQQVLAERRVLEERVNVLVMKYEGVWERMPEADQKLVMKLTEGHGRYMFRGRYETLREKAWEEKKKKLGRQ